MQKIILFAACLLILSTVYGQNKSLTLSGKITDAQTGEALAGANIDSEWRRRRGRASSGFPAAMTRQPGM